MGGVAILVYAGICILRSDSARGGRDPVAGNDAGASREGSPEFADLTKDIIISTDDRTVESPMGLGTVSVFITGNVKNKGTRTITTLEVNVAVITQKNEVLKEKRVLVVPVQHPVLGPDDTIPITVTLAGFDRHDDRANIRWKVTAIKAQ